MSFKKTIPVLLVGLLTLFLITTGFSVALTSGSHADDVNDGSELSDDNPGEEINGTDDDDDDAGDDDDDDDDIGEDDDDEGAIGHFKSGTDGRFVSFDLVKNKINNYTINIGNDSINAFDKITIENFIIDDEESKGSYYEIEGDDTKIKIYDVAPGLLKINSEGEELTNISFDLGDFEVNGNNGRNLNLTYNDYNAKILAVSHGPNREMPVEIDDDNGKPPVNITPKNLPENYLDVTIENGYLNYSSTGDMFILFRMTNLENDDEDEIEDEVNEGISKGEIGGEVTIDSGKGEFKEVSVNYADMKMMTQVKDKNRVRVMVSSDTLGENGKIVSTEIYKEVLDVDKPKDVEVRFDGEKISMADDYKDLKDTSDGAEYLISIGQNKVQVLVMVPHFSTHSIDIMKAVGSGSNIIGNFSYYIPAVVITSLIIASTVWVSKKR